jgi:hypothetical protein
MSTGYTAGILDGTTKDFNQFAKNCSRAFIMHLRDEPMDSEYKKREVSDYHIKAIEKAKTELTQADSLSDEELIIQEKNRLIESKKHHLESKEKDELNKIKMDSFLEKAKSYVPPTENHQGIANFMIEQLVKTIDFDCNSTYHIDKLKTIDDEIAKVNANDIRSAIKIKATKDIAYHAKEHEEDVKRCEEHNQWYENFIKNL